MVIDESGSMWGLTDDSVGGFNGFLTEQRKLPWDANLTVVKFSDKHSVLYEGSLQGAPLLSSETYRPSGGTALCDAVGAAISRLDARLAELGDDAPSRVVFGILTDGRENASLEYSMDAVKGLIEERQGKGWVFVFLAANQDAFSVGGALGVNEAMRFDYAADGVGLRSAYHTVSNVVSNVREGGDS